MSNILCMMIMQQIPRASHPTTHTLIGASLSKPHIDHDNGPCTRNNCICVSIYLHAYVFMYHLSRVCRTLVPEIRVCPEMLRVFRYIDILTCMN